VPVLDKALYDLDLGVCQSLGARAPSANGLMEVTVEWYLGEEVKFLVVYRE
jgi:hypothetical protein